MKNGDGDRIFYIYDDTSTQQPVLISGLMLTGGDLNGSRGGHLLHRKPDRCRLNHHRQLDQRR